MFEVFGEIFEVKCWDMENNRAPAGAKIDKTQTQVKLQFLSQSGQFKITNLAPQFKNARKSKLSVFQHFCIHQKQLCRIYNPLKQHVVDTGLIWRQHKVLRTERADVACCPWYNLKVSSTEKRNKGNLIFEFTLWNPKVRFDLTLCS